MLDYAGLFNNYLNNKFFPELWQKAKIFPILKKNKAVTNPFSYRSISLTPALGKVYEAVVDESLKKQTAENKIISDNQFGFTHRLSTHAVHKILDVINDHLHNNRIVGACPIDLEKGFDSVWIAGLLYILRKLNYPTDFIQLIWHMTQNRSFVLQNGTTLSSLISNIIEDLMQGTVNSSELFNIFTYNIPLLFGMNTDNCTLSPQPMM